MAQLHQVLDGLAQAIGIVGADYVNTFSSNLARNYDGRLECGKLRQCRRAQLRPEQDECLAAVVE
jgi:hypothetical protein